MRPSADPALIGGPVRYNTTQGPHATQYETTHTLAKEGGVALLLICPVCCHSARAAVHACDTQQLMFRSWQGTLG